MRLVFLGCSSTISSASSRRYDAFEHDKEWLKVSHYFNKMGHEVVEADWRKKDLPKGDLYWIRSAWDYQNHLPEFLDFIKKPSLQGRLVNHPDIIRQNLSKSYLKTLAKKGVSIVPSYFPNEETTAAQLWRETGSDDIIVKPLVGANGVGQMRLKKGKTFADLPVPKGVLCQPFIEDIMTSGEISLIYLCGQFSHACRKSNPNGDYRIQSLYGGIEIPHTPTKEEIRLGNEAIATLFHTPLAARIDIIPTKGGPLLIELEAIEPYLYPDFCENFGETIFDSVMVMQSYMTIAY